MLEGLYVHQFCELFSDSHNPVSLDVKVGHFNIGYDSNTSTIDQTKLWDTENIHTFVSDFNADDIISLCMHLDYFKSQSSASQENINQFVCFLNDIYINNCRRSFGTVSPGTTSSTQNSRSPWFNKHCKLARDKFHNDQHLYKLRKNHENRRNFYICSKTYKKTLHQDQVKYKNSKIKELRKLKRFGLISVLRPFNTF